MKGGMLAAAGAALAMTGCAAAPPMRGWTALAASTEQVEVTGIGGGTKGAFRLGSGATGRFERGAGSVSDDSWRGRPLGAIDRHGGASFTVAGAGVAGVLAGTCRYDQASYREVEGGRRLSVETEVTAVPFQYRCRFTRDGRAAGTLVLDEQPSRRIEVAVRRAGEIELDGRSLQLVSEHGFDGPTLAGAAMPVGYRFEEGGRAVGAAILDGRPRLLLPRDPAAREAAVAAALALALLWDPGDD